MRMYFSQCTHILTSGDEEVIWVHVKKSGSFQRIAHINPFMRIISDTQICSHYQLTHRSTSTAHTPCRLSLEIQIKKLKPFKL